MKSFIIAALLLKTVMLCGQEKTIEIRYYNYEGNRTWTHTIKTNAQGIITEITPVNSPDFDPLQTVVESNAVSVKHPPRRILFYEEIRWENDRIYVKPPNANDYEEVAVNPVPGVIFEGKTAKVLQYPGPYLIKEITARYFLRHAYTVNNLFLNNVYFVNNKYEFIDKGDYLLVNNYGLSVEFYYLTGYYEIRGDSLYNRDMVINVINYYILSNVSLFSFLVYPLVFLESPFVDDTVINSEGFAGHYRGVRHIGDLFFVDGALGVYLTDEEPVMANGRYPYTLTEHGSGIRRIDFDGKTAYILQSQDVLCFMYNDYAWTGLRYVENRGRDYYAWVGPADRGYTASSYLTEGDKKYEARNLARVRLENPWVEGVRGPGIGQYIDAAWGSERSGVILVNGYISARNPGLYRANNRVKRLLAYPVGERNRGEELTLADTPEPQFFRLGFNASRIRFEILEVYAGERYDDTCLSMLIGIGTKGIEAWSEGTGQ
jgi:hypothetical protein